MSLYHGLYVRSTSSASLPAVVVDNDTVNVSEGLFSTASATGNAPLTYVPATPVVVALPAGGHEYVALLQITGSDNAAEVSPVPAGTISIVYGTAVTLGSGLSTYPALSPDNFLLAQIGTPAAPLTPTTTAISNAFINNLVLSAEFGGR